MATDAAKARLRANGINSPHPPDDGPGEGPPLSIMQTSPVANYNGSHAHSRQLPLSLILLITSYLDNVGDIARVTRASRLLYYLNLPRLYENVTLQSYPEIRYVDGQPEGFGAGSPFAMGLDGLVSRPVAAYVKGLTLLGTFKDDKQEDFEKGRVPDNTMMLNIVIRAAIDKMEKLQRFSWQLTSNPLKTVYQALSARSTLTHLTLRFDANRLPRPTVTIPGIPSLKYLHLAGMDPLCYNDDPSVLLLEAVKLETLKLEWSPRMRREREPSVQLSLLFGAFFNTKRQMSLKHWSMKNLFARKDAIIDTIFTSDQMESLTAINCMDPHDPSTVFVDRTWVMGKKETTRAFPKLSKVRIDRLDEQRVEPFNLWEGLQEVYIINRSGCKPPAPSNQATTTNGHTSVPTSPDTPRTPLLLTNGTPITRSASPATTSNHNNRFSSSIRSIGSDHIAAISSRSGKTLRKLLLSERWTLSTSALASLLQSCPKLEELGVAVAIDDAFDAISSVIRHAPRLKALRVLMPSDSQFMQTLREVDVEMHCLGIGHKTCGPDFDRLRWFGVGDMCFELRGVRMVKEANGKERRLRDVRSVSWEELCKRCSVWGEDTLEL